MKIALIANNFLKYDAIGKYTRALTQALPEADFDFYLELQTNFSKLPSNIHLKEKYFIQRLPLLAWYMLEWKIGRQFKIFEKIFIAPLRKIYMHILARKLLAKNYDLIWMQWGLYFNGLHLFEALAKNRKQKKPLLIFDYHGTTPPELIQSKGKKMIAQKSLAELHKVVDKADLCLVRSGFMQEELKKYAQPKKIVKLPLPIFYQKDQSSFHSKNKKIKLLYVGRIAKHKNLEIVLRAMHYMLKYQKASAQNIYFYIIGNFLRPSLKAEKERLERLAEKLNLKDKIKFLGEVSEKELKEYYQRADIFIIPSLHEGFCWPAVDALNYGLPVIYADKGALPEIIGEAGLKFYSSSTKDLAQKIIKLTENPNLRQDLIQKGRHKAQLYSWKNFQKNIANLLQI